MKKLKMASPADVLSDSDSESNNEFALQGNAFETLLEKFESGDELLGGIPRLNNERVNALMGISAEIEQ